MLGPAFNLKFLSEAWRLLQESICRINVARAESVILNTCPRPNIAYYQKMKIIWYHILSKLSNKQNHLIICIVQMIQLTKSSNNIQIYLEILQGHSSYKSQPHNRRWCTFSSWCTFYLKKRPFWPFFAILSCICAFLVYFYRGN